MPKEDATGRKPGEMITLYWKHPAAKQFSTSKMDHQFDIKYEYLFARSQVSQVCRERFCSPTFSSLRCSVFRVKHTLGVVLVGI